MLGVSYEGEEILTKAVKKIQRIIREYVEESGLNLPDMGIYGSTPAHKELLRIHDIATKAIERVKSL